MDFAEEKTPAGYILKILFKKSKFLVFNSRGESIYVDTDNRNLLHKLPVVVFLGKKFHVQRDYLKEYSLLKVRNSTILLDYKDIAERNRKFIFLPYSDIVDMIPAKIKVVRSYSLMLKDVPTDMGIDYLIIDDSITETETAVLESRYKPEEVINVKLKDDVPGETRFESKNRDYLNINIMSDNSVFLAIYHLRNMAISSLNQLLLDFEIPSLDTKIILYYINNIIEERSDDPDVAKNLFMLTDIRDAFEFYLSLIDRDDEAIRLKIDSEDDLKKLSAFNTLVSKVRSMNPGTDDQLLYTEYENHVLERIEILKS